MSAWPAPSAATNVAVNTTAPLSPKRLEAGRVALMEPPIGPSFPAPTPIVEPAPTPEFDADLDLSTFDQPVDSVALGVLTSAAPASTPFAPPAALTTATSLASPSVTTPLPALDPFDRPLVEPHVEIAVLVEPAVEPAALAPTTNPLPLVEPEAEPDPHAAPEPQIEPAVEPETDVEPASEPENEVEQTLAPVVPEFVRGQRTRWIAESVGRFLALFWCWTIIWLALWSLVPMAIGWSPNVVTSGSMEPSVRVGSVVHVDGEVDLDSIGPGAIITFQDPAIPEMRVTHRITGVEQTDGIVTGFRTKGDNNATTDSSVVPVDNVEGVARLMVPFAGTPKVWSQNGQWLQLGVFVIVTAGAAAVAIDTIMSFISGRKSRGSRGKKRQAAATAVAIAAMLGAPSSTAAFTDTTDASGNSFDMTTQWHLDAIDRESPVAHWRLGEAAGATGTTVFTDGFETTNGYTQYGSGRFRGSKSQARSGVRSGRRSFADDPNGGWRALAGPVTSTSFTFEVWIYRPSGWAGGSADQVGLEDSAANGYTFDVDHTANTLGLDRRTGGAASPIGALVAFNPPEDAWYRLELVHLGAEMTVNAYDGSGTLLATTSATDATTTSFDRLVARGGHEYFVDDMTVTQLNAALVAADRVGTLDASYVGDPVVGAAGLVVGDPDTAVDLDGVDQGASIGDATLINTTTRAVRSVELWFQADVTSGRQVIYEEGGNTDGMIIYLDGTTLYGYAWSESTGWSNTLVASTTIAAGTRYHAALTLDAVTSRSLVLYVDGVAAGTSTKTDSGLWSAHADDGAIGYVNGSTEFHDGDAGAGYYFDGTIDEVVLYNSVLSPSVIANHHNAGR